MSRGRGRLTPKEIELRQVISDNINNLLKHSGKKQIDIHRTTGIPKSTLTGYIKATSIPTAGNVQKLADFFSVKKSEIDPRFSTNSNSKKQSEAAINYIYEQLDPNRQKIVYECAEEQLEEQLAEQTKPAQQSPKITDIQSYKDEKKRAAESYGAVSAGTGEFLFGIERAETVYLPESDFPDEPFDYVLKINGDSMLPTYKDGEYIFVKSFSNGGHVRSGMLAIVLYESEVYFKKVYLKDECITLVSLNKEYADIVVTEPEHFKVLGKVVS